MKIANKLVNGVAGLGLAATAAFAPSEADAQSFNNDYKKTVKVKVGQKAEFNIFRSGSGSYGSARIADCALPAPRQINNIVNALNGSVYATIADFQHEGSGLVASAFCEVNAGQRMVEGARVTVTGERKGRVCATVAEDEICLDVIR